MQNNLTRSIALLHSFAANLITKWGIVFFVVLTALCGLNNTATGQTFNSSAGITGASGSATPTPYPSTITVSGIAAPIASVIVGVNGITSASLPDPFSLLLVGPGGQNLVLLSGGGTQATSGLSNVNLFFEDQGSSFVTSGNLNSGTYKPTSFAQGNYTFPSPAPSGPYNLPGTGGPGTTLASVFTGTNANGVWNLYAVYDGEAFTISSWALTITQATGSATTTSINSNINPSFTAAPNNTVTYTATVSSFSSPVTSGTVTFNSNGTAISGGSAVAVSGGVATCTTTFSAPGAYTIQATYNGNSSFASSSGSLTQQVNPHPTTVSSISANSAYSNAGTIQYTVHFGASISGLSASNFSLTTTGAVSGASIASVSPSSGSTYTVTVNTGTGDGTIGLNLNNATGLTPGISTSLPFTGGVTTIDKTPPVVTIGAPSTTLTSVGPVTFDVSIADAHFNSTSFNQTNVIVNSTGTANYSQVTTVQNSATDFTVTVAGISGNGTLSISIQPGTSNDLAGNTDAGAGPSSTTAVLGNVSPSISYASPQTYPINMAISPLAPVATISSSVFANTVAGTGLALDYNGNAYVISSSSEIIQYHPGNSNPFPLPANSSANIAVAPISATVSTLMLPFNGSVRAMDINNGTFSPPVAACPTSGSGNLVAATHPASGPEIAMINKGFDPGGQIAFLTRTGSVWSSPAIISNAFPGSAMAINNYPGGLKLAYVGTDNNLYYATYSGGAWSAVTPWATPNISMSGVVAFALDAQGNVWYGNGASVNELTPGSTTPVTVATLPSAPNAIAFDVAGNLYVNLGTTIEKLSVINNFQLSPSLPAGLSIDHNTGVITGTPTAATAATDYTVTATAGSINLTATVNIRTPNIDASLSNLHLSNGTLSPVFSGTTTSYTASVGNGVTSMTFTPTASDTNATVTVNGTSVTSGTASPGLPLIVGANTITTAVTAQDGTTKKTYTVTVTRAGSSNDNLNNLHVSGVATLSPVFASATTSYTANVDNSTTSVTVTPKTSDPTATLTINGAPVASGAVSAAIPLNVGPNIITALVTAQNGTSTKTYTITVTRAGSSNANLVKFQPSNGTITPAFSPATTSYTISVSNALQSMTVKPTEADPTATITVNGTTVASGTASQSLPLAVGPNIISTLVTAQDGTTTKTYKLTVTRAPSVNDNLNNLHLSNGVLSPVFASATTSYTASVSNGASTITVTPTTADATATVTINGATTASGTASVAIPLNVGPNTITTIVTAQDGISAKTYTITVTRAPSSNAALANLKLTTATLSPTFTTKTLGYTSSVPNTTSSVTVTPTLADATATVTVNGVAVTNKTTSGTIALSVGSNTITTVITAQDGTTMMTYTVTVTRATGTLASADNNLAAPLVENQNNNIIVHQGISPNGDGLNDVLTIDGIANYPDNKLTIMNRSGALIFEVKGYDNSLRVFNGHSNKTGKMQQPGTYFYSLEYKAGGVTKHKTGFIILKY